MKQAHRKAHFYLWLALAFIVPLLFCAALWVRRPMPTNSSLPVRPARVNQ